ncbi:hypothetical protein [Saccharothrix deserti]|uniref:hypothetical protein n=1 Tax=Saccharothrix deserti TaxID=2593674 RepID=UPI00131DBF69|nr:hypothetical protein [Saccharothrix deserti]
MTDVDCRDFDRALRDGSVDLLERLRSVEVSDGDERCIVEGLEHTFAREDWDGFELYVLAAQRKPSGEAVPLLCAALLLKDERVFPEEVLAALNPVADARAVPALREMLHWRPEWDEFHAIAVKALWALAKIDDDGARALVAESAARGPRVLRDLARQHLTG